MVAIYPGFRFDRIRGLRYTLGFCYFTLTAWAILADIENAFGASVLRPSCESAEEKRSQDEFLIGSHSGNPSPRRRFLQPE